MSADSTHRQPGLVVLAQEQQEPHPAVLTARDLMSSPAVSVDLRATLSDAWAAMTAGGHRHLVVRRGHHCVGVLDDRTLLACWPGVPLGPTGLPVAELLRPRTTCVLPGTSAQALAAVMVHERTDVVPVVDEEGGLLGVVTMADVAQAVATYGLTDPARNRP